MQRGEAPADSSSLVLASTARIVLGEPRDVAALVALATENHALDATIFEESEPYFWPARISTDEIDTYGTRMQPSSLKNYAADAAAGVAFLPGHDTRQLPFGRSITGKFTAKRAPLPARVEADFYTLRGLELGGVRSDQFILGIRSGIVHDVSIGFYGGTVRCSIDGYDMRRDWWNCPHIPGFEYAVKNDKGEDTDKTELAVGLVEDAHLAEVSAVYDGACPGAAILKAQRMADADLLPAGAVRLVNQRYRLALAEPSRRFAGVEVPTSSQVPEDNTMPTPRNAGDPVETPVAATDPAPVEVPAAASAPEPTVPESQYRAVVGERDQYASVLGAIRSALIAGGIELAADASAPSVMEAARGILVELPALRKNAAVGEQLRNRLVDETIGEGVRAFAGKPDAFKEADWRATFGALSIEQIELQRDGWREMAGSKLPGGRATVEVPSAAAPNAGRRHPAFAYGS